MGKVPCCCDKTGLKKGPWTAEEDQKLIDYIQKHGQGKWRTLPKSAGLKRCGKSCRLRWTNYLRPDIKRGRFSFEEEETIIHLHGLLGNKWSAIAAQLPGRTDNEIKNYWNTHIRKRLLRMGIDPVTHAPRLDILGLTSLLYSSLRNNSFQLNNFPNTLGMGITLNQNLLDLASSILLSSQHKNHEPLCNPKHQYLNKNFLSSFGTPICVSDINRGDHLTTNEQIMQLNHFESTPIGFSSLQNSPSLPCSSQVAANCIGDNATHSLRMSVPLIEQTFESSNVGKVQDFGGVGSPSLSSSPMSGLTTLNSSSPTYVSGHERDSYGGDNGMHQYDLMNNFLVSNNNFFTMMS